MTVLISPWVTSFGVCPLLVPVFRKSLLHMFRHKNIYNIGVDSYVLFSKNLLGIQTQKAASKVKEFSTFLCMQRCTSHLTEIVPFDAHLTTWDQYPVFFPQESPWEVAAVWWLVKSRFLQGSPREMAPVWWLPESRYCFPSRVSLGLTVGGICTLMAARKQVFFSFPSFLRAYCGERLQSDSF